MLFDLDSYMVRRKVLKIFGASFHVYDPSGTLVGFSSQKAFKLKEDIRVYADEQKAEELLVVRARQIVDFSAAYDVVDPRDSRKVGAVRRKGWSSIIRDSWEVLDENDSPVASLKEDSTGMAMLRRFLTNLIPQKFHLEDGEGRTLARYRVRFNPFIYKLEVTIEPGCALDKRVLFAIAVLLAAVEGRQG